MITVSNIEDFLDRVQIFDMSLNIVKSDPYGDFIQVFDADFNFNDLREAINKNRIVRGLVSDNGLGFVEIYDSIYINGYKTKVGILCSVGQQGFGTTIKMIVKNVQYPFNGELKTFLGFESIANYLSKHKQEEV